MGQPLTPRVAAGADVDPELAVAFSHAQQIAAARRMTTGQLLRQARHLALGRRLLQTPERFAKWLHQLGISPGHAELLLSVDRRFGTSDGSDHLDAGALLLLARPDVPDLAVHAATYAAKRGQFVTAEQARAFIARHSQPRPAADRSDTPEELAGQRS